MRCTQAEKLIPLFAGDDLPVEQTVELREHLESCARCQQLVAEFEESRNWLSSFAAPEFDEATLGGMRDRVLEEIEKRPRLLEWGLPSWKPRFVFAASMALLLLIAASALIVYRQQKSPITKPGDAMAGQTGRKDESESPQQVDRDNEQPSADPRIAESKSSARKPTRKAPIPDLNESPQVENQPIEPDLIAQAPTTEPAKDDLAMNRDMLRIEIQTADPNIRIIWLTPKESSSSTKPNTNIR